jgi:hypothetical protein
VGRRRWVLSEPAGRYLERLPAGQPPGLRLATLRRTWYRLDAQHPSRWTWRRYPTPRSRFDSAAGAVRVRYAGDDPRVAMRESFDRDERIVSSRRLEVRLVELTGTVRVLDLRRDRTLDALGLDDQISTARAPAVWAACQRLTDLVQTWFGERCDGIVYRSRTTPERGANLAFFAHAPLTARDLGPLREQEELLRSCVLTDGFTIRGWR